jgi:hypothetical protein
MPKFEVQISGKDLAGAQAALDAAGFGKLGDLLYEVGRARDPARPEEEPEASTQARAVIVEADTAEVAKRRVEEALPAHGYNVA